MPHLAAGHFLDKLVVHRLFFGGLPVNKLFYQRGPELLPGPCCSTYKWQGGLRSARPAFRRRASCTWRTARRFRAWAPGSTGRPRPAGTRTRWPFWGGSGR
nr:hypothetical protein [Tanacetum cinerariifolium]